MDTTLQEKEDVELVFDKEDVVEYEINYNLFLVGKFLGEQVINFAIMKQALLSLWRLIYRVALSQLEIV
ncbi:hypothetical protein Goari_019677, partial [Gossypium aridum]|nr:hypothetical protein [Gossypium aridum]